MTIIPTKIQPNLAINQIYYQPSISTMATNCFFLVQFCSVGKGGVFFILFYFILNFCQVGGLVRLFIRGMSQIWLQGPTVKQIFFKILGTHCLNMAKYDFFLSEYDDFFCFLFFFFLPPKKCLGITYIGGFFILVIKKKRDWQQQGKPSSDRIWATILYNTVQSVASRQTCDDTFCPKNNSNGQIFWRFLF